MSPQSGLWRGTYQQNGSGHPFEVVCDFSADFRVTGKGTDGIGAYTVNGQWTRCGQVQFIKQYIGKHSVDYAGNVDQSGKRITGRYWNSDVFEMQLAEPSAPPAAPKASGGLIDVHNPGMPYSTAFTFEVGQFISMQCTTAANCKRFNFNLKGACGEDLVFHLDFRFDYFNERNTIVCNSLLNNSWGKEERTPSPVTAGCSFHLAIVKQQAHFEVYINGKHVLNFENRAKSSGIVTKFIHIMGEYLTIQRFSCHAESFQSWWASYSSGSSSSGSYSCYYIIINGLKHTFSSHAELEAFRMQNSICDSYTAVINGCQYFFVTKEELEEFMAEHRSSMQIQSSGSYIATVNGVKHSFNTQEELDAFMSQQRSSMMQSSGSYTCTVNGVSRSFNSKAEMDAFMEQQTMHMHSSGAYTATVNGVKHSFNSQEEMDAFMAEQRSQMMHRQSGGGSYTATVNGVQHSFSSKEEMDAFMQSQGMGMGMGMMMGGGSSFSSSSFSSSSFSSSGW